MSPAIRRVLACCVLCWTLWGSPGTVRAAKEFVEGFEDRQTSWKLAYDKGSIRLLSHRRSPQIHYSGTSAEMLEWDTVIDAAALRLEHPLPPARVLDELQLSVWLRSNRDCAALAVRVVFPYQENPKTGGTLTVTLEGERYNKIGSWQRLECKDIERQLRQKLPQLRRQLSLEGAPLKEIDLRGLYVDQAVIQVRAGKGSTELFLDELRLNPVVSPQQFSEIQQVAQQESPKGDLEVRLDRLLYQGRPFFPRVLPYHGETPEELARMRLNVVWIPDYRDTELLQQLQERGLRAMATPPRVSATSGASLKTDPAEDQWASLAPFGPETAPVIMWNIGTRISPEEKRVVATWIEQIRNADRRLKRPVVGDVAGLERSYSRELSLLGVSRHTVQSGFELKSYREWLSERRQLAQPGSSLWTWIQTESLASVTEARRGVGFAPPVVEPEQIRLQVYAALSAGYRGLGFWTQDSLDSNTPGSLERKLMVAQLNMELELLEPFLATGTLLSHTPLTVKPPAGPKTNQLSLEFGSSPRTAAERAALLRERDNTLLAKEQAPRELEAALLRTDYGLLLLPVWYGVGSQFVPGQMVANDATIIVPGADETSSAWEITTTGIRSLDHKRVTGGIRVTIPKFDMTSAVLLTNDIAIKDRLHAKVNDLKIDSATVSLELARAKLQRVDQVDRQLHALGVGQVDAARILTRAQVIADQAQQALQRQDYHGARIMSHDVLQLLRILQHSHWRDATRNLTTPTSSPHTLCFQTLPDHWKMLGKLGRNPQPATPNLLLSGDFEDFDTMVAEGWRHEQRPLDGVRAVAELYPRPRQGASALRLLAVPETGRDLLHVVPDRPVTVTTPGIPVQKGQIVSITGWVRVASPVKGSLDGALVFDSILGSAAAFRVREASDWRKFQLWREVPESGEITITAALTGFGEVWLDDLQVVPYDPAPLPSTTRPGGQTLPAPRPASSPMNRFRPPAP